MEVRLTPRVGSAVVAAVEGELLIRRLSTHDGGTSLVTQPADAPPPAVGEPAALMWELTVRGVVTRCLHHVQQARWQATAAPWPT